MSNIYHSISEKLAALNIEHSTKPDYADGIHTIEFVTEFSQYQCCLQMNAFAVVSDSGTLPEESSFFTSPRQPFPAVYLHRAPRGPRQGLLCAGMHR